jgi:hypothetical protein
MSEANKGVNCNARFSSNGIIENNPSFSAETIRSNPASAGFLFYQSTEESLLSEGAEGKTKRPEGFDLIVSNHPAEGSRAKRAIPQLLLHSE